MAFQVITNIENIDNFLVFKKKPVHNLIAVSLCYYALHGEQIVINISNLSYKELSELKKQVEVELVKRKQAERQTLLSQVQELVASKGYSLGDLLGEKKGGRKASASRGQFRNPADPTQTWTGHGRKPKWALEWIASGRSIEELRV